MRKIESKTHLRVTLAWAIFAVMLAGAVLLLGCGGSSGCPETQCGPGYSCIENRCVANEACVPECGAGYSCEARRCIPTEGQCSARGESCHADLRVQDGFVCIDWDSVGMGICSVTCLTGSCPQASLCFYVASGLDGTCQNDSQCQATQVCTSGRCRTTACRPSECEGAVSGAATCAQNLGMAANCHEIENGANYCFGAGQRALGESCDDIATAIGRGALEDTCSAGLGCVDGRCQEICEDDSDCAGAASCIGADRNLGGLAVGYCGEPCEAFTTGSCSPGSACRPTSATQGVCQPAGSRGAYESCEPGVDECIDGTSCVVHQERSASDTLQARCYPLCNIAAAPAGADGQVGAAVQAQRDATCPQPEEAEALGTFVHLAQSHGALDIYLNDAREPVIAGLEFEDAFDAEDGVEGLLRFGPGSHTLAVRAAGDAFTEAPLAESNVLVQPGEVWTWALLPLAAGPAHKIRIQGYEVTPLVEAPGADELSIDIGHAIIDMGSVDVLMTPAGGDWASSDERRALASSLELGERSARVLIEPGSYDIRVFAEGSDHSDGDAALLELLDVSLLAADHNGSRVNSVFLRGTLDQDDLNGTSSVTVVPYVSPEMTSSETRPTTCRDLGNGVYGYCQQTCDGGASGFERERCEGASMGCRPEQRMNGQWRSMCAPVGGRASGQTCNPWGRVDECAEGLYCLEYGATAAHGGRGLCMSYCAVDRDGETETGDASLSCAAGQACRPLDYAGEFDIGQCGHPCTPDDRYSDTSACPRGLQSCKPIAGLRANETGSAEAAPLVSVEQPFCSASGDVAYEGACFASDCLPGSECMYPRSAQSDFTSTLLSPYFGRAGLAPSCHPQCDPFNGDQLAHQCAPGETCLFNYPWSADVGHCAPIVEELGIGQACTRPGESCGEDSICVINAGQAICLRFCQYTGGTPQGAFDRSTCPPAHECAPLVSNLGYCITR